MSHVVESLNRVVWVKTEFVGWHHWPDAPPSRAYLASPHRHLFKVLAQVGVEHNDRDVEFHDLLDVVNGECETLQRVTMRGDLNTTSSMSCEDIAERIIQVIVQQWPDPPVAVSVSEDGEVGATLDVVFSFE